MLTKEEIMEKVLENKPKLKGFGVKKIALFGSYANDQAKEDSDLDFLVEFHKGRGLFDDYFYLLQFLKGLLGKEVDLVKPSLIREELKESILEGKKIEAEI